MALAKPTIEDIGWNTPHWPERRLPASAMRTVYGPLADELTIRFGGEPRRDIVTMYIATPDIEYAGVLVRWDTGEVVGVQVDYLADYAVGLHPAWQPALEADPPLKTVMTIVSDIKQLYLQLGTESSDSV